jgi:hypothetical protein
MIDDIRMHLPEAAPFWLHLRAGNNGMQEVDFYLEDNSLFGSFEYGKCLNGITAVVYASDGKFKDTADNLDDAIKKLSSHLKSGE